MPSAPANASTLVPTIAPFPSIHQPKSSSLLKAGIVNFAKYLGFNLVGFSPPKIEQKYLDALNSWIKNGYAADMQYMKDSEKLLARSDLAKVLPGVKSVIVLGVNYYYKQPPLKKNHGRIARYASGRDYHKVIGKMLKKLVEFLQQIQPDKNHIHKAYVDTGPILERALAQQSGIGQIGKNALVISREFGSWIFLAEILTTIDMGLDGAQHSLNSPSSSASSAPSTVPTGGHSVLVRNPNPPSADSSVSGIGLASSSTASSAPPAPPLHKKPFGLCGQCTKCLTACPTGAIIAPGVVDSRLCISYLTIENRKKIPAHLAKKIKKTRRLFGCDICQEVCPHNEAKQKSITGDIFEKFSNMQPKTRLPKNIPRARRRRGNVFQKSPAAKPHVAQPVTAKTSRSSPSPPPLSQIPLQEILNTKGEQKFRLKYEGTPLMRTKLKGLKRSARVIQN